MAAKTSLHWPTSNSLSIPSIYPKSTPFNLNLPQAKVKINAVFGALIATYL